MNTDIEKEEITAEEPKVDDIKHEFDVQKLAVKLNIFVGENIMFRNSNNQICIVKIQAIVIEQKDGNPIVHIWSRLGCQTITSRKMLNCIMIVKNSQVIPLGNIFDELDIAF